MKFEELNIKPEILRAVEDMGFEEATPIQSQAIPVMESGVDMIGQAQTGTGKTAAFGIPLLEKVIRKTERYRPWCCVQPESWRFRYRKKSVTWQNIFMALKCCRSTADRI